MDHARDGKTKGANGDGQGRVRCRASRRVEPPEVFIGEVRRKQGTTHHPRCVAPRQYVIGGDGEGPSDDEVPDANENRRANPGCSS